jgi:hypothetical protein
LLIALALEVLELIENQYEATCGHRLHQLGKLQQITRPRMLVSWNAERFQGVVHRRENASRLGVRDLDVEDRLRGLSFLDGPLDQGRLADSTPPRDFGKEPPFTIEHALQIREMFLSAVKLPVGHATLLR